MAYHLDQHPPPEDPDVMPPSNAPANLPTPNLPATPPRGVRVEGDAWDRLRWIVNGAGA